MSPKLSILIPTKDRYTSLLSITESLEKDFKNLNAEIIIQDNTEDNREVLEFIQNKKPLLVKYFHIKEQLSMSENCNLSVKNSTGDYLILIGDDDYVFPTIFENIKWMQENNIEALSNIFSVYQWKGVEVNTIIRHIPEETYIMQKGLKRNYRIYETEKALDKVIKAGGAIGPQHLPRLYHGLVSRTVLNRVYETCKTYFPGPSPDMAIATALCCHLDKHAFFDFPFSVAGMCKTSNTGLSTVKKNVGDLEDMKFLDQNYIKQWDERIPKIWAVSTIWPQSMIQSLKDCKHEINIDLSLYYGYLLAYSHFFSPKIVKKIAMQKIWATKNPVFAIRVFFNYCVVWCKRIYGLLFTKNYHFKNVTDISKTYLITYEKYTD